MKRVVIIGAGPAGITAGLELKRKAADEYAVTILEKENRIGGISATVDHNGNLMDLGGHRFFSKEPSVNDWWQGILPMQDSDANSPEKNDRVMLLRRRVSRIYCFNKFFDYPVTLNTQTLKNLGFVRTLRAGAGYMKALAFKKDEDSLENFYINRFGKELYSTFFESYTEKLWGRHPRNISADWGAQRVKGISVTEVLKNALSKGKRSNETSLIEEFKYPKLGPGQLWSVAAEEFKDLGGEIITGASVSSVNVADNRIVSVTADGKDYPADIFISTMPLKELVGEISGEAVPDNIKRIAEGLPYRDFVTVGVLLNKLAIKNETKLSEPGGLVPDCWIYVQDKAVKLGRIQVFNNWSPYLVKEPDKTVWLGLEYFCDENDSFWNLSEKECALYAVNELRKIGIIDENTELLDYHRERVRKAYPAYFDTYASLPELWKYLDTYENLFCIGRNGLHRYNNMDHSMLTAFYAVDAILSGSADREKIRSVNTEKEYHEEKRS
ncbi:MAG: NAD(P)/FAD-dependent oxidoreductase [Clostridia bacterium]|nr:NAD(P)/FAD-dependent oxidoreductase [Clostridia bacterium]